MNFQITKLKSEITQYEAKIRVETFDARKGIYQKKVDTLKQQIKILEAAEKNETVDYEIDDVAFLKHYARYTDKEVIDMVIGESIKNSLCKSFEPFKKNEKVEVIIPETHDKWYIDLLSGQKARVIACYNAGFTIQRTKRLYIVRFDYGNYESLEIEYLRPSLPAQLVKKIKLALRKIKIELAKAS